MRKWTFRGNAGKPGERTAAHPRPARGRAIVEPGSKGVAAFSRWWSRDRMTWFRAPAVLAHLACGTDVNSEGFFGFTVVARDAEGAASPPPMPGDEPQLWAGVDV